MTLRRLGFDKDNPISELSDSDGLVDFGYCDAGRYEVSIKSRWGFKSPTRRFNLHPSTLHTEQIVCPPTPEVAEVSWVVTLPEDLQRRGVQTLVKFSFGTIAQGDDSWQEDPSSGRRDVLVRPGAWEFFTTIHEQLEPDPNDRSGRILKWYISRIETNQMPLRQILTGVRYSVGGVRLVMLAHDMSHDSFGTRTSKYVQVAPRLVVVQGDPRPSTPTLHPLDLEVVPQAGQPNEWLIPIPDELIEQARDYFNEPLAEGKSDE